MRALITGASSGIGKDMTEELAIRGYNLVLVARNKEQLEQVKKDLLEKYASIQIEVIDLDLSVKENCFTLYNKAKNIDVLINNAGFGVFGEFIHTDMKKELDMINTNITAVHILTKLYLQDMAKKNQGHILNVASIAGMMPGPLMAGYYASKNYVVAFTRAIQKEMQKKHVKVKFSILCPGPVNTNFNQVAGVNFKIAGKSSKFVAKYAIEKMFKGKLMIVPGISIKMVRVLAKISPTAMVEEVAYHMQVAKQKGKKQ